MENCETPEELTWFIDAVRQFNWSKAERLERIAGGAHKNGALVRCINEEAENQITITLYITPGKQQNLSIVNLYSGFA